MCKKLKSKKVYKDLENDYKSINEEIKIAEKIHKASHKSKNEKFFEAQMIYKERS